MPSPRRIRWMNSRCPGTLASASDGQPGERGSFGQTIGAQLELSPGRSNAGFGAAHPQRLFQLQRLLFAIAAGKAIGYEKPKLAAQRVDMDVTHALRDLSDAELYKALADEAKKAGLQLTRL